MVLLLVLVVAVLTPGHFWGQQTLEVGPEILVLPCQQCIHCVELGNSMLKAVIWGWLVQHLQFELPSLHSMTQHTARHSTWHGTAQQPTRFAAQHTLFDRSSD